MELTLLIVVGALLIVLIIIQIIGLKGRGNKKTTDTFIRESEKIETAVRNEIRDNRHEMATTLNGFQKAVIDAINGISMLQMEQLKSLTESNQKSLTDLNRMMEEKISSLITRTDINNKSNREELSKNIKEFQASFDKSVESFNIVQKEKFGILETKQNELIQGTEKKLEQMRETVDEKLQKTLNERLSQSFETVGKQLQSVQEGLGEMKTLAHDVGGLKKVLSNVKTRGGVGEVQLEMLLEQILAPDQYDKNVRTKKGSSDSVEFAIKLPGKDDNNRPVYLPVDAKFPKDAYENLLTAYDSADARLIESATKSFDNAVKSMARDISDKYIDPPNTTDFGIMFMPFESIYAEVVRKASLLEDLQRNYKIIVTGPTTLAAILNSLQMGFRTLAIQKRSSEVWRVLASVKKEFQTFGGMLQKAQNNIQTGLNQLDDVVGKRTRAIERKLRNVEIHNPGMGGALLGGTDHTLKGELSEESDSGDDLNDGDDNDSEAGLD